MKENIFDVLIYLFENYLDEDLEFIPDSSGIKIELIQAGFGKKEVNSAFTWLESLAEQSVIKPSIPSAFRIFTQQEEIKLDLECRNFLLFLERSAIIDGITREIVIERAMAFDNKTLSLKELKWTVLLVLLSHSDDDEAYFKMEDIIYDLTPFLLH